MKRGFLKNKPIANKDRDGTASVQVKDSVPEDQSSRERHLVKLDSGKMAIKLPIGTVNSALPAGCEPTKIDILKRDASSVDYDEDEIIITTLPARLSSETVSVGANGWSECILKSSKQKRAILSIPGFPHSVPHFDPPRYRIGPSAHGKGTFATCDIELGDLIFAERPAVVMPRVIPIMFDVPLNATRAEFFQVQLKEDEKVLETCVGRMLPQDREAFFDLYNCHTDDGSGPIVGRIRTNGICIGIPEDEDGEHSGTFIQASRLNHSCIPNVSHRFDIASFSLRLHAVRPIKAGEELYISYANITVPTEQRQSELRPYAFKCTCPACSNPTWDTRLALIKQSCADITGKPDKVLKESLRWIKVIEDLQLQSHTAYGTHLLRAGMMATLLGNPEMGKKYSAMARKIQLAECGKVLFAL